MNLAISDAYNVQSNHNTSIIQTVGELFNTPKRQAKLQNTIKQFIPETRNKTRWVKRQEAILIFIEHFNLVIEAFEKILTWIDTDTFSNMSTLFS